MRNNTLTPAINFVSIYVFFKHQFSNTPTFTFYTANLYKHAFKKTYGRYLVSSLKINLTTFVVLYNSRLLLRCLSIWYLYFFFISQIKSYFINHWEAPENQKVQAQILFLIHKMQHVLVVLLLLELRRLRLLVKDSQSWY